AIIGTGPAGMFAAMELIEKHPALKIVMIERGPIRDADDRSNLTCGWGGSGAFSDGKLNWTSITGGHLLSEVLGEEKFNELVKYVDGRYLEFGGESNLIEARGQEVEDLKSRAFSGGLDLVPFPIRHLGTDRCYRIVENIRRYLQEKGITFIFSNGVEEINKIGDNFILTLENNERVDAKRVIAAVGRPGADWLVKEAKRLGLKFQNSGVDVGFRIEVRAKTLEHITKHLYEAKIFYESPTFRDRVRTFCMCPYGFVGKENYRGLTTVNGHSYADNKSENTNFAVLVTQFFTDPFDNPISYGKYVAEAANRLSGGGVLIQRLGDLKDGRRSTQNKIDRGFINPTLKEAVPGDLSLSMYHRQTVDILEMLEALESVAPGIASDHTLLYGNEVKFYSVKIETGSGFETSIPGLYVAGDGSGYTRGLLQASMQGVVVAKYLVDSV
ncbi:MAG: FAD-dependent oxidoreductase, partial [Patescibacteria group bacterium]|nr:FAD-dependent oxidoreductase [Patescibacteria group bacterium]